MKEFKKLKDKFIIYLTFLIAIFSSNLTFATDYTISNGSTQTTQVSLTSNSSDTLTVEQNATLNYNGYYAIDADNQSFSSSNTEINNSGTITSTNSGTVMIDDSSNVKIVNSGTITTSASGGDYVIKADDTSNLIITNTGTISAGSSSGYGGIYGARASGATITNTGGTISATDDGGIYMSNSSSLTITNNANSTITSSNDMGARLSDATNLTLTNHGTISATGDDYGLYITDASTASITNSGTISAQDDYGIRGSGSGITITNSGTISANDRYGIHVGGTSTLSITNSGTISAGSGGYGIWFGQAGNTTIDNTGNITVTGDSGIIGYADTGTVTITNSGTISAAEDPISWSSSRATWTITNSGTISATGSGAEALDNVPSNTTITNTGTISAPGYAFTADIWGASGINLINKTGTINGTQFDIWSLDDNWGTLTNGQGGQDCLTIRYYLPTNYKIYIASSSSYGKLCSTNGTSGISGDTNFSIDTSSTLTAGTYTDVFTSANSSHFASGTTGTCSCANGSYDWTLSDSDGNNNWDLIITSNDTTAPTLSSSEPNDNATGVAVNANIVLTFSEAVDVESGNITIKKTSDDSTIETIDVTGAKVSGSGGTDITINPGTNWDQKTEYYVLIDATSFDDGNSNSYAGISSTTALSFTTIDSTNPSLSSSTPADGGTDIKIDANIKLVFSEAVDAENGNVTIKLASNDSTVEAIDVTGNQVSGSGSTTITINPSKDLKNGKEYYILIDATAFDDSTGNSYAGISSSSTLNFKTKKGQIFSKTVKTLTKNQSTASVQTMAQSLTRVNSRMNYIRPGKMNKFRQNIRLAMDFDDPFANRIFDSLAAKFLKSSKETKNWAVWTEGNVAFGRIGQHDGNLGQDISSDGITIGIDKKTEDNKTIGFAINKSWQDTEVGTNDANMDAEATSILTYGSIKIKDNAYIESAIGLGEMDIDLDRSVTGGRNKGDRGGKQIFSSFTYLYEPETINEENTLNYFTRLDLGYTVLDAYTETGDDTAVHYNKQHIKSASLSIGFNLSRMIEIEKGIITPLLKFEIGKDQTDNSISEAYYVTDSSEIYTNAIGDQGSGHAQLSFGLGVRLENDLTINLSYDHYRNTDDTFMNSFTILFRKLF